MSYRLPPLVTPLLALSLAVVACGDDGTTPTATAPATRPPWQPRHRAPPSRRPDRPDRPRRQRHATTQGGMSNSISSTVDPDTEPGPTTAARPATPTPGNTTETVCPADQLCAGDCCAGDELCDNGECVPDCGGPPPCGVDKRVLRRRRAVSPRRVRRPGRPVHAGGVRHQAADEQLRGGLRVRPVAQLCLPSKADPTCQYIPPAGVFKPEPLWTWGRRRVIPARRTPTVRSPRCAPTTCAR
jgi:hypothetical protein